MLLTLLHIAFSQIIFTIDGTGTASYSGDGGFATSATLNQPTGIALDISGNIYIADFNNNRIRQITVSTGTISTVVGTGAGGFSGDGGPSSSAALYGPFGLSIDSLGTQL